MHRSLWYYKSKKDDTAVVNKLQSLAERYPTRGLDDYYGKIRLEGLIWNRKRVLRIYRTMKLTLRRKHKRRLPQRIRQSLEKAEKINYCYSMDFVSDALVNGRRVRILNVMDDCSRECLAAYADYSIPAWKVIMVLDQIVKERGKPVQIRVDNGPEFISKELKTWCDNNEVKLLFIQPGKPMQNGYIERLNRTFREDVLNAYLFETLEQLRILCDEWVQDYNCSKPHSALKGMVPAMIAKQQNLL